MLVKAAKGVMFHKPSLPPSLPTVRCAVTAAPPEASAPEPSAVEAELHRIDPDALTPREALDALYRLKSIHNTQRS